MDLQRWGWDEQWEAAWAAIRSPTVGPPLRPARVLEEHRDRWVVTSGAEEQTATCPSLDLRPAVGDWVAVRAGGPRDSLLIVARLPRRTKFTRGAAGRQTREQVVAANVDTIWIVHGLDSLLNPRRLEGGALLIDTPGMRELQLWEVSEGLDRTFSDITELAAGCRYADCVHDAEPGCAVKAAVERGALEAGRLDSFRKLLAEAAWQNRKSDPRLQQEETGRIRAIHKSMREHWKNRHR